MLRWEAFELERVPAVNEMDVEFVRAIERFRRLFYVAPFRE